MLAGGSRSGKTTLLVHVVVSRATRSPFSRHAILRLNGNAARASIGLDTLPKVMREHFPDVRWEYHRQDGFVSLPGGAEIWIGGLDEQTTTGRNRVEKILGQEYATIYFNECSQIPYASVLVGLTRLAQVVDGYNKDRELVPLKQRVFYDLNPIDKGHWTNVLFADKRDPISRKPLAKPEDYQRMFINPIDNKEHLSKETLEELEALPEKYRKRFFEGVYTDDVAGALWTYEIIVQLRDEEMSPAKRAQQCKSIVVGVDPSGVRSANDLGRDEVGIIVAGLGLDDHGYILADLSLRDKPEVWGRVVVDAAHKYRADRIVAEQNFGGAMVESNIRAHDPEGDVKVKMVDASQGKKWVRAEPISSFYEQRKVHHCGRFPRLEEQMVAFTEQGYLGEGSPDHVDAMVWALTDLMLKQMSAWGVYKHTGRMAGEGDDEKIPLPSDMEVPADWSLPPVPKVDYGFSLMRAPGTTVVKLKAPDSTSTVHGMSGTMYNVRGGFVEVMEEDATPLLQHGWKKVA